MINGRRGTDICRALRKQHGSAERGELRMLSQPSEEVPPRAGGPSVGLWFSWSPSSAGD